MEPVDYQRFEGPATLDVIQWVTRINQEIFAFGETVEHLTHFFENSQRPMVLLALQGGEPVGFKVGFAADRQAFESWRGGCWSGPGGKGSPPN